MDLERSRANEKTHLVKVHPPVSRSWRATIKLIMVSGAGLFADGWDIQVINVVLAILEYSNPDSITPSRKSLIACMTFVGVIIGQVGFGAIGDLLGRKLSSIITAILTIAGVVAAACVTDRGYFSIGSSLAVCRFFAGVGIGGEYPISAAISREMGDNLCLDRMQLLQINMILYTLGSISQALYCYILIVANASLEVTWRSACAVGAFPSLVALFLRLSLEESEPPHPRGRRLSSYYSSGASLGGSHFVILVGCCLSWALFNFAGYGQSTFSHVVAQQLMGNVNDDIRESLQHVCVFAIIMASIRLLGNFSCVYFMNVFSTRMTQWIGFFLMTSFIWLCCLVHSINWLATIFFMLNFSMSGVLSITNYLMPTLCFPKSVRGTAVGIAAGMGKAGAAVGTALFPIIEQASGFVWVIFIYGAVASAGIFTTTLIPPVESKHLM